ncbi:hypothetical protein GGI03_004843 [Coemansia sp. RSA 2337]|nr:hypothetical protein GGI14_003610 [Coemansia sp. S680]KAJ2036944.1 hypothetical protein H4S03_003300 [Coemansia sp. S3946]KAJ2059468.1 hypothetical protein GGI08_003234 [Coemansia sp. S2]KAJ2071153.1 hypothetical protein GGH13_003542 [Coemansia sp. S155-1]KAJ2351887.1 hypothetical protein GGH92_001576 [Coemansia sp. RSA 2673]KAJ2461869.1 hypothetical protein GGI03_004843 [Coemansia sp. RSA 2337]
MFDLRKGASTLFGLLGKRSCEKAKLEDEDDVVPFKRLRQASSFYSSRPQSSRDVPAPLSTESAISSDVTRRLHATRPKKRAQFHATLDHVTEPSDGGTAPVSSIRFSMPHPDAKNSEPRYLITHRTRTLAEKYTALRWENTSIKSHDGRVLLTPAEMRSIDVESSERGKYYLACTFLRQRQGVCSDTRPYDNRVPFSLSELLCIYAESSLPCSICLESFLFAPLLSERRAARHLADKQAAASVAAALKIAWRSCDIKELRKLRSLKVDRRLPIRERPTAVDVVDARRKIRKARVEINARRADRCGLVYGQMRKKRAVCGGDSDSLPIVLELDEPSAPESSSTEQPPSPSTGAEHSIASHADVVAEERIVSQAGIVEGDEQYVTPDPSSRLPAPLSTDDELLTNNSTTNIGHSTSQASSSAVGEQPIASITIAGNSEAHGVRPAQQDTAILSTPALPRTRTPTVAINMAHQRQPVIRRVSGKALTARRYTASVSPLAPLASPLLARHRVKRRIRQHLGGRAHHLAARRDSLPPFIRDIGRRTIATSRLRIALATSAALLDKAKVLGSIWLHFKRRTLLTIRRRPRQQLLTNYEPLDINCGSNIVQYPIPPVDTTGLRPADQGATGGGFAYAPQQQAPDAFGAGAAFPTLFAVASHIQAHGMRPVEQSVSNEQEARMQPVAQDNFGAGGGSLVPIGGNNETNNQGQVVPRTNIALNPAQHGGDMDGLELSLRGLTAHEVPPVINDTTGAVNDNIRHQVPQLDIDHWLHTRHISQGITDTTPFVEVVDQMHVDLMRRAARSLVDGQGLEGLLEGFVESNDLGVISLHRVFFPPGHPDFIALPDEPAPEERRGRVNADNVGAGGETGGEHPDRHGANFELDANEQVDQLADVFHSLVTRDEAPVADNPTDSDDDGHDSDAASTASSQISVILE